MTAFLQTPEGGIQPIDGKNGAITNDLIKAEQGKPGKQLIANTLNQIIAATQVNLPSNACDRQAALLRAQQQIQQRVQVILQNYIIQQSQQTVEISGTIQGLTQNLQNLQKQPQTETVFQQIEVIEKDIQNELNGIIVGVIGRASSALPQAAKVANSSAAGVKTIASVAESLAAFVPSQGINMKNYGSTVKTIQTVSQSCYL